MERGKVHQARRMTNLCLGNRVRYTAKSNSEHANIVLPIRSKYETHRKTRLIFEGQTSEETVM